MDRGLLLGDKLFPAAAAAAAGATLCRAPPLIKSYLDSFQNGQIIDIPELGDGKYTHLYTNKGEFSIEESGDIGFTVEGEYSKYNDVVGKWNVENNMYMAHAMESGMTYTFVRVRVRERLSATLGTSLDGGLRLLGDALFPAAARSGPHSS